MKLCRYRHLKVCCFIVNKFEKHNIYSQSDFFKRPNVLSKNLWFKNISSVFHTYITCIKRQNILFDYDAPEIQPEKRFHCISTCKIMLIDCNLVINIHGSVVWQ